MRNLIGVLSIVVACFGTVPVIQAQNSATVEFTYFREALMPRALVGMMFGPIEFVARTGVDGPGVTTGGFGYRLPVTTALTATLRLLISSEADLKGTYLRGEAKLAGSHRRSWGIAGFCSSFALQEELENSYFFSGQWFYGLDEQRRNNAGLQVETSYTSGKSTLDRIGPVLWHNLSERTALAIWVGQETVSGYGFARVSICVRS